jgi:transposase
MLPSKTCGEMIQWRKEWGRRKKRKECVTAPITLPRFDAATRSELYRRYQDTPTVESRTRYQMVLLAQQEYKVPQIARMVLRSEDTVARVLKRVVAGGLDAVPRRSPPGRERRVTAAWEAELLRVIELDPARRWDRTRPIGPPSCEPPYLGQHTGIQVTEETVRVYLHAHGYVCKRPIWTDASAKPKRKPITWETHQGRGALSRCHSTRTSTRAGPG